VVSEPEALIAWLAAHGAPLQLKDLTTPPDNAHSDAVGRQAVQHDLVDRAAQQGLLMRPGRCMRADVRIHPPRAEKPN